MSSPRRTTPPPPSLFSAPPSTPASILVLLGYFGCIAALIAALSGTWAMYRRHVELVHWPLVATRVEGCRTQRYVGIVDAARPSVAVQCRLAYGIGAVHYAVPVRSHITVTRADSLASWVAAHPAGSTLLVHYDPVHPAHLTLAGTGLASEDAAVSGPLLGALAFGLSGLGLLLAAAGLQRRRERQWLRHPIERVLRTHPGTSTGTESTSLASSRAGFSIG